MLNYVGIQAKCTGIALRMLWQGLKDWGGQVSIGVGCPIPPYSTTLKGGGEILTFSNGKKIQ